MAGSAFDVVRSTLIRAFTENVVLKVTSLVIAIALFGMVRGAGTVQRSMEVSLLARLPPANARRVLLTDLPDRIRVTVRGSSALVASLRPDGLGPVQLDLSDGRRASVILDASLFTLPGGVQIDQVQPSSLQLSWDALIDRAVPVRAALAGPPGAGLRLAGEPVVTPPSVEVTGAALYVEALASVRTELIDISHLGAGNFDPRVALEPPRRHARYEYSDGVRVTFSIEREIADRRFDRLPVTAVGAPRVELRPPLASIVLRGAAARIDAIQPAEIVPTVDVADANALSHGPMRLPIRVEHLPEGVTLVAIEPSELLAVSTR